MDDTCESMAILSDFKYISPKYRTLPPDLSLTSTSTGANSGGRRESAHNTESYESSGQKTLTTGSSGSQNGTGSGQEGLPTIAAQQGHQGQGVASVGGGYFVSHGQAGSAFSASLNSAQTAHGHSHGHGSNGSGHGTHVSHASHGYGYGHSGSHVGSGVVGEKIVKSSGSAKQVSIERREPATPPRSAEPLKAHRKAHSLSNVIGMSLASMRSKR